MDKQSTTLIAVNPVHISRMMNPVFEQDVTTPIDGENLYFDDCCSKCHQHSHLDVISSTASASTPTKIHSTDTSLTNTPSTPANDTEKQERLAEMKLKFPDLFKEEIDEDDDEDVCPICLELFVDTNPAIPCECSHTFHFQCVEEWLQRSSECPVCYKKLKYDLMSSEQEVAFARRQLAYQSPQQIHAANNNNNVSRAVGRQPFDIHSYFREQNTRHAHRNNMSVQPAANYNNRRSSVSPQTTQQNQRPRSRNILGKLFDKLISSFPTVSSNQSTNNRRRSQILYR